MDIRSNYDELSLHKKPCLYEVYRVVAREQNKYSITSFLSYNDLRISLCSFKEKECVLIIMNVKQNAV